MLAGVSGTGVLYLLGLTRPGAKKAGAATPDSGTRTEAQAQQDARRQDAAEALQHMKTANQNQKQQRKAAAKAKVDRLKKELESLRLMGGDSKAVARRAAQIARELAAAAKEYASAGGSGMASASPAPSAAAPSDDGAEASAEAEANKAAGEAKRAAGEAEAQADEAQAEGESQEASGEDQPGHPQADEKGADKAAAGKQEGEGKAVAEKGVTEKDDRQAVAQAFQEIAADMARRAGERKGDSDFAAEVRRLMAMAKNMVAHERRRAQQEGDTEEADRLSRQVRQAEADMEQSFAAATAEAAMPVNIVI